MNKKGFTLIELIMVLLLVAVIAAVVVPRLDMYSGMQLQTAAKKVASDIRYSQSAAMTNRTTQWVRITFNTTTSYRIYGGNGVNIKNPVTQEPAFWVRLNKGEYQGVRVQNIVSTTFNYPLGNPSSGGVVTLQKGTAFQNISVMPFTGKVVVK